MAVLPKVSPEMAEKWGIVKYWLLDIEATVHEICLLCALVQSIGFFLFFFNNSACRRQFFVPRVSILVFSKNAYSRPSEQQGIHCTELGKGTLYFINLPYASSPQLPTQADCVWGRDGPAEWGWSGIPCYRLPWDGARAELWLTSVQLQKQEVALMALCPRCVPGVAKDSVEHCRMGGPVPNLPGGLGNRIR